MKIRNYISLHLSCHLAFAHLQICSYNKYKFVFTAISRDTGLQLKQVQVCIHRYLLGYCQLYFQNRAAVDVLGCVADRIT